MPRDRIVELRRVPASQLRPSPANWRLHPDTQRQALAQVLDEVGIADAVIARQTADGLELVDGHLRSDLAGDEVVPVLVVDLDDAEAATVLATLDPIGAMADVDGDALGELLSGLKEQPEINYGHLYQELDIDLVNGIRGAAATGDRLKQDPNDEAYTPAWLVNVARAVLGGIDLDPASCEEAQQTVQATRWYGLDDDGLERPWRDRVWLNPPWSAKKPWFRKLFGETDVTAWCACAPFDLTNSAIRELAERSMVIWAPAQVPKFVGPGGAEVGAWFQTALFFGGPGLVWDAVNLVDGLVLVPDVDRLAAAGLQLEQ